MLEELFEAELNDAEEQEALRPPTIDPGDYLGRVVEYKLREESEPDGVIGLRIEIAKHDGKMTVKFADVYPFPLKRDDGQYDMRFIRWSQLRRAVAPEAKKVNEVLEAAKAYPFTVKIGKATERGQYINGFKAVA